MEIFSYIKNFDKFVLALTILKVTRALVFVVDLILDVLFGYTLTEGSRADREAAKEYEKSAQIVDVWLRAFYVIDINQPKNFLVTHKKYVNPDFILKNDNVILMGITPTHAFFSITNKPENDLRRTEKVPFLFIMQLILCDQLLILPISSFHRLADQLGDPKDTKVCVVNMTGRCGSTLLCQMFNLVSDVRSFSECWAFDHSHHYFMKGHFSYDQHKKNFQSSMRILCKPENEKKITHILVKMSAIPIGNNRFTRELFPKFKTIYMTRNPKSVSLSWMKFIDSLPKSSTKSNHLCKFLLDNFPVPYDDRKEHWLEVIEMSRKWLSPEKYYLMTCLFYAAPTDYYLRHKDHFDEIFIYDDFVTNTKSLTKKFFKLMQIDENQVENAMEALKKDSQDGIFGQRGNDKVVMTETMWREIDEELNKQVPGLTSKIPLDQLKRMHLK